MATAIEKAEEAVKKAADRAKQAKDRLAKVKSAQHQRELKAAGSDARLEENRRKYLMGAYALASAPDPLALVVGAGESFGEWLGRARDDERALFGLAPVAPVAPVATETATAQ